ncbi:MAG: UvrD-helicase domain-containing protein [Actinobacteria bacterium]|nr:UvrD-helicase domain-containing protein [Actinomycetota bacterium]
MPEPSAPPVPVSEDLVADLNPAQREAVTAVDGPVLCIAGAGSGKTRVLTHRIAHLIRDLGTDPFSILAITFTNKAASEMRDRVGDLVGSRLSERMWVTTFHSACARILRREAGRLGYTSTFTIYDQADAVRLTTQVMKDLDVDERGLTPRGVHHAISAAKDTLVDFDTYAVRAGDHVERRIAEVYREYQSRLHRSNAVDFDDLIVKTVELFQLFPDVLDHYRQRFAYLLVDEYQDTNRAQYHLVNQLADAHRNVMVVGDSDQGIFGWRGATIRNILDFERDFPEARVVALTRNYRSTQTILDAANAVIRHNTVRHSKELWTERDAGEKVVRYRAQDERDEAAFVAEEVERLVTDGYRFGDVAVFYRTNAQSRVLEEVFVRVGTPYRVVGGVRFYERKEIKDILTYLRVLVNPADDLSARRILNEPRRGIGAKTEEWLDLHATRQRIAFLEACRQAQDIPQLGPRQVAAVTTFVDMLDMLRTLALDIPVPELIEETWTRTGYLQELLAKRTVEALGREENLRELQSVAREYHERSPDGGLEGFLESVTLVTDQDELLDIEKDQVERDQTAVTFMTLHTAKGLEYPVVFITGMDDRVFPHVRSLSEPEQLEEERRLCYVGLTRAKDRLYVAHADHRTLWGGTSYNPPSRFLSELPERVVDVRSDERGAAARRVRDREALEFDGIQFRVGDAVRHSRFGRGRILEVAGDGESAEALVDFPEVGKKRLLLLYAPLVKE